ncbi:SAM-dependent methyltransferase [Variovorax ginsengisoli]|uniref:SAM-dependent methyltransferase n=1 Tax=Variovorax ginsengisoli TaxID=363844 RepID=A0ABT8SAJ7_9BURK|nr:SAM-dependent methyltransferase [Variovorax ginsengisoli]MDN8616779.1 SAM-dependent methyltransferase [Variovorax ginsengisoli]MDO1535949.1 SAM-dependent methyltransferase [Variovorax ginsengisoli]
MTKIIDASLQRAGGWLPFDRFMALALYAPGLGYYASASRKFGRMPASGSDFVTAPEMTPLFGRTLAVQVAEALEKTGTRELWEFGAGTGALALQLLDALGDKVERLRIVDLSGTLRERQQQTLAGHAGKVEWLAELPPEMRGVVVGNEVLDAMPVQLLVRTAGQWHERGVVRQGDGFAWADRPTELRPPVEVAGLHDYLTEIHPQAEAFVATLADRLKQGAAFFIDYGFPEAEYYHPQRHMGTVMCHRGHQADGDPLADVGTKDITAHVNFTGVALAGQDAGLQVLGYCSQARFLLNAGILPMMEAAPLAERAMAARLIHEHEMGELFKVIGFAVGEPWEAIGFAEGDRSHTL